MFAQCKVERRKSGVCETVFNLNIWKAYWFGDMHLYNGARGHKGESKEDMTGTRDGKHTTEYRKLVGSRLAETTAAVKIKAEGVLAETIGIFPSRPPWG